MQNSCVVLLKNNVDIIFHYVLFRSTTDVPSCSTIRDLRCTSSNKYEEDPLFDDDEYLCKMKYQ